MTWALGAKKPFRPLEETGWIGLVGIGALAGHRAGLDAPRSFFTTYGVSFDEYMASLGRAVDDLVLRASSHLDPEMLSPRWVDGTPENTNYVLLLRHLFPAAKFIFLVRDPTEVIVSLQHFDRIGGESRSISEAARIWSTLTENGMLAYRAFGPDAIKIVPYKELVDSPEATLIEIFRFLGEPYAPEAALMMANRINSSSVTPDEHASVKRRIERGAFGAQMRRRFDEVLSLKDAPWTHDTEALHELESMQRLQALALTVPRLGFARRLLNRFHKKRA